MITLRVSSFKEYLDGKWYFDVSQGPEEPITYFGTLKEAALEVVRIRRGEKEMVAIDCSPFFSIQVRGRKPFIFRSLSPDEIHFLWQEIFGGLTIS